MNAREKICSAATSLCLTGPFDAVSVAQICERAGVSNGSFFHAFRSKDALGAELYLKILSDYHAALTLAVASKPDARTGISLLLMAHLTWVEQNRAQASFLFEQSRADWMAHIKDEQALVNEQFASQLADWFRPLMQNDQLIDVPAEVFFAQLIGPAQVFCRAWLSGRSPSTPMEQADTLAVLAQKALSKG